MASQERKISIKEMMEMIVEAYNVDPRQNLGFRGTPGIGKTEGIYGAADLLKKQYPGFLTKVIILSQIEAVDMRMPFIYDNDKYKFLAHDDLKFADDAHGILFLDEAANGQPDVLKAMQQILSDRKLGDIKIPDGIMIIIACNNKSDRAGVNSIPTAFANRIEWHQVTHDYEAWLDWAFHKKLDVALTSFIKKFPNNLNTFDPSKDINATPRTWTKVDKVLKSKFMYDRVAGLVGEENATQFMAWTKMWDQFPDKEDIETDPDKAKLPKDMQAQFALTCAVTTWVNRKNWSAMYNYMARMNLEYQMLFMRECPRLHPREGFKDTKEYSKWIQQHQGKIL